MGIRRAASWLFSQEEEGGSVDVTSAKLRLHGLAFPRAWLGATVPPPPRESETPRRIDWLGAHGGCSKRAVAGPGSVMMMMMIRIFPCEYVPHVLRVLNFTYVRYLLS